MKTFLTAISVLLLSSVSSPAQERDSIVISVGRTSRILFTVEDRADLEVLKHYNFQKLFEDVISKLESTPRTETDVVTVPDEAEENEEYTKNEQTANDSSRNDGESPEVSWEDEDDNHNGNDNDREDDREDNDSPADWVYHKKYKRWGRPAQSFNFDLGTNNYLSNGSFPGSNEIYAVRPWGSWYVGLASVQRSRMGKNFFLEWSLGVNWYNFKFQDDNVTIAEGDNTVLFARDTRDADFVKSKLTASYLFASLVPVLDLGDQSRKSRVWKDGNNSFRIGAGPYIGYRIASHSKVVYNDGNEEKEKNRDSFYLNNLRYGVRLQLGFRTTDLFFNYDLNELFAEGRGPSLNAFSFGIIL